MKTINLYKSATAVLLGLTTFAITSCNEDDGNGGTPASVYDVIGEYSDAVMAVNGNNDTVDIAVDNQKISIEDFPLNEIVESIVSEEEADEATSSLSDITYNINYTAEVVGKNVYMSLSADTLSFEFEVGGQTKEVKVAFASEASALYNTKSQSLSMSLKAEGVTLDGAEVESFTPMDFIVNSVSKSKDDSEDEVPGKYFGEMSSEGATDSVEVEVGEQMFINGFPLRNIVSQLLEESAIDGAIESAGKVVCTMNYDTEFNNPDVALSIAPQTMNFEIDVEGTKQDIEVFFNQDATGTYNPADSTLTFSITADSVKIDAVKSETFKPTEFTFLPCKKTVE